MKKNSPASSCFARKAISYSRWEGDPTPWKPQNQSKFKLPSNSLCPVKKTFGLLILSYTYDRDSICIAILKVKSCYFSLSFKDDLFAAKWERCH